MYTDDIKFPETHEMKRNKMITRQSRAKKFQPIPANSNDDDIVGRGKREVPNWIFLTLFSNSRGIMLTQITLQRTNGRAKDIRAGDWGSQGKRSKTECLELIALYCIA